MKKQLIYFLLPLLTLLSACSRDSFDSASTATNGLSVPKEAYQDKPFSMDISVLPFTGDAELVNAPAWMTYNPATKTIEGTPTDNSDVSDLYFKVHDKSGNIATFGPYQITVYGDPLKKDQWHLRNTGQSTYSTGSGTAGEDINAVQTVIDDVTGAGVKIAVSDTGIEVAHEDLSANILKGVSKNFTISYPWLGNPTPSAFDASSDPTVAHGTAVAGIIAAVGWNEKGGRGIAPNAKLAGFRFLGSSQTAAMLLEQAKGSFDIFNYSYGSDAISPQAEYSAYLKQLRSGATTYRDGKGALYVKSAGNDFIGDYAYDAGAGNLPCYNIGVGVNGICHYFGNSNLSGFDSVSPDEVIVGALDANGVHSSYSTPGSNIWVSAPGGEYGDTAPAILTTDLQGCNRGFSSTLVSPVNSFENSTADNSSCKYTSIMNGTSSAAPMVSGVIALMLEANPALTSRDVKYILASTATKNDPTAANTGHPEALDLGGHVYQQGWVQNAAGFWFHNWYGFGRVNADAAVAMAKVYSGTLNPMKETQDRDDTWFYTSGTVSLPIPDNDPTGTSSTINVRHQLLVETVQIRFSTTHSVLSDLGVELTSPSGTKSILLNINNGTVDSGTLTYDAKVASNAFFGEPSLGNWTLKVIDGTAGDTGDLSSWDINIIGHVDPNAVDTTAPDAPTSLIMGSAYSTDPDTSPALNFTGSVAGDLLRYEYAVGVSGDETKVRDWNPFGTGTTITATSLGLASDGTDDGTYYINIRAVDTSENVSPVVSASWILDTQAPASVVTSLNSVKSVTEPTGTITGTCEPNSSITLGTQTGVTIGANSCDSSGVLSFAYTVTATGISKVTFKYTLTDAAGNVGDPVTVGFIFVDPFHDSLALGDSHGCLIFSGSVKCWGKNEYGQLGTGDKNTRPVPTAISGVGVLSIAAGRRHTCALIDDDTIYCWGSNQYGQLGDNTLVDSTSPVQNDASFANAKSVTAGDDFSCGLTATGSVKCWGHNNLGQLGDGTLVDKKVPTTVIGGVAGALKVSAGRGNHACALITGGTVKCWGDNTYGQLGNNSIVPASTPVDVTGLTGVKDIQTSKYGTCALTATETKCWGRNNYYQLGDGTATDRLQAVTATAFTGNLQYSLGDTTSCVTNSSGRTRCFGSPYAKLLDGYAALTPTSTSQLITKLEKDVVTVKNGHSTNCAVMKDGNVICWGKQSEGEMGNGGPDASPNSTATKYMSQATGVLSVATGASHMCVLKSNGTVWCVGSNEFGQLGNGGASEFTDLGFDTFKEITSLSGAATQLVAGKNHTCVLLVTGKVRCWGANSDGQLGTGDFVNKNVPTNVTGLGSSVVYLAAGAYHTCAILDDLTVQCWGDNTTGQLSGTAGADSNTPATVAGVSGAARLALGYGHSCSLDSAGAILCWGANSYGQLGDGTPAAAAGPVSPSSPLVAVSISAGESHTCAVTSTKEIYCWGRDNKYQLGDNDNTADKPDPTSVVSLDPTFATQSVHSGANHSCARSAQGKVLCWGYDKYGQVGDLTNSPTPAGITYPTPISDAIDSSSMALGENYTCDIGTTKTLQCWGHRLYGQFGLGKTYKSPSYLANGTVIFIP